MIHDSLLHEKDHFADGAISLPRSREIKYLESEIGWDVVLAYAMTTHRSQGSQYAERRQFIHAQSILGHLYGRYDYRESGITQINMSRKQRNLFLALSIS